MDGSKEAKSTSKKKKKIPTEAENRALRNSWTKGEVAMKPRNQLRQIHTGNYDLKAINLVADVRMLALELTVSC